MVAGVKVASQTPAVRSGQRIIFVSLDDATGPIEVTVFQSVQHKVAQHRVPRLRDGGVGAAAPDRASRG